MAIDAAMLTPIVTALTDNIAVILPVGVSIMGVLVGVKLIPRIFHMFL